MTNTENSSEALEEARKARERAQQANWFLGGTAMVVLLSIGISITMARNDKSFAFIGLAVGVVVFWAVTKFGKK